ncbi:MULTISPECIES: DNA-binding protein [Serratia]|uniref:DNA-binding protein n=1 Tax=Serratia fonticola TaxID=47917 RepID=A0AAE9S225_SERFO|nr:MULTISPECIES: DNA-binding protein [Serratia]USN89304.1 DNA-binding protein [Serratia fonticola]
MSKNQQKKMIGVRANQLPADYPFGDLVEESISDYAKRIGKNAQTVRTQADVGSLPILQDRPGGKRRVNLYAIYLRANAAPRNMLNG